MDTIISDISNIDICHTPIMKIRSEFFLSQMKVKKEHYWTKIYKNSLRLKTDGKFAVEDGRCVFRSGRTDSSQSGLEKDFVK